MRDGAGSAQQLQATSLAGSPVRSRNRAPRRTTPMAHTARPTTVVLALLTFLAALAGMVALSAPAQAEAGYKFWGYYHLTGGKWVASSKGAGGFKPADGSVE